MTFMVKKLTLVIFIVLLFFTIKLTGVGSFFTIENIYNYKLLISKYIQEHFLLASFTYILLYIFLTTFSVPGSAVISLAGGYFFGIFPGLIYINFSAVAGATLAFLVSRYILGDFIQKRYGDKLHTFNAEIDKNGYMYMLTLRLIPLFPFFLVNLLAGISKIRVTTYIWTTALGIFPASIVFTYAGKTLEKIKSVDDILSKDILIAFILLGILAQLPRFIKYIRVK